MRVQCFYEAENQGRPLGFTKKEKGENQVVLPWTTELTQHQTDASQ